ncbi:MAG: MSHA biogenesis protein MshJ [Flavobacterium sp.]|jgi:MSHA biogenesis protein MshJ
MNLFLQNLFINFEGFSLREKVLVGITVAGMIMFALQVSFIDPLYAEEKSIKQKILMSEVSNNGHKRQLRDDNHSDEQLKLARLQQEVDAMNEHIASLDLEMELFLSVLVPAQDMPDLLQTMLDQNTLQLVALENTAPKPVFTISDENGIEKKSQPNQLFHHGITIKVRGEYQSILSYIRELEDQKWKLNWRSIVYEVGIYPIGEVEIRVETLSQEKWWLGV